MEDHQEDPLAVHCFCVCSGSVLLGDLFGVSRFREFDLLSVLSIYPGILLCVFIVYHHVVSPRLSVWPHLFCGAGHEKRRGEQLKWSL